MTSTSDERRAVAFALRGDPNDTLIPQSHDGFENMTYHQAAYRFWDMCRRVRDAADVDIAYSTTSVLADLIDPTCHLVETIKNEWSDGSTTYLHRLSCGHMCETVHRCSPVFCPYCGARLTNCGAGVVTEHGCD